MWTPALADYQCQLGVARLFMRSAVSHEERKEPRLTPSSLPTNSDASDITSDTTNLVPTNEVADTTSTVHLPISFT